MHQESKREVMKINEFKANCVCDAGVAEERQPTKTVKEEKRKKTLMSTPEEKEEDLDELLTQWKTELNMLQDWLDNTKLEDGCQKTVTKIARENNQT